MKTKKTETETNAAAILLTATNTTDPMPAGSDADAAALLPVLRDQCGALAALWRDSTEAGDPMHGGAINAALCAVGGYPDTLARVGIWYARAREGANVKHALRLLDVVLRHAGTILARAAAARGLDPADVTAGIHALRQVCAPADCGDGTQSGIELRPGDCWPDCWTLTDWARLPPAAADELRRLRDCMARLNHGEPVAAASPAPERNVAPGLEVMREKICFTGARIPGEFGVILEKLTADEKCLINLRIDGPNGKRASYAKMAARFRSEAKPDHEYTGEQVRNMLKAVVRKYPATLAFLTDQNAAMPYATKCRDAEQEPELDDAAEIARMTGHETRNTLASKGRDYAIEKISEAAAAGTGCATKAMRDLGRFGAGGNRAARNR